MAGDIAFASQVQSKLAWCIRVSACVDSQAVQPVRSSSKGSQPIPIMGLVRDTSQSRECNPVVTGKQQASALMVALMTKRYPLPYAQGGQGRVKSTAGRLCHNERSLWPCAYLVTGTHRDAMSIVSKSNSIQIGVFNMLRKVVKFVGDAVIHVVDYVLSVFWFFFGVRMALLAVIGLTVSWSFAAMIALLMLATFTLTYVYFMRKVHVMRARIMR